MANTSYPFSGQSTTENQYTKLFRELQDSGVVDNYGGTDLRVSANATGMKVSLSAGIAIIRGHVHWADTPVELPVQAASPSTRIDRVVLRLDPTADTITPVVVKGDYTTGAPPTLTQTDLGVYELLLAEVQVRSGVVTITSTDVTDRRTYVGSRIGIWSTATRPAQPRQSQMGLNMDTNYYEFWNGSKWLDLHHSSYVNVLPGNVGQKGEIVSDGTFVWMSNGSSWKRIGVLRDGAVNIDLENNDVTSGPSGGGTWTMPSLITTTFNLPYEATVDFFASYHAMPDGNAAGELRVTVDGVDLGRRYWHSHSTSHHQWPSKLFSRRLAAGAHSVRVYGTVGAGSTHVSVCDVNLTVVERAG